MFLAYSLPSFLHILSWYLSAVLRDSTGLGGRQIIGDIQVNHDNILKLETRTKGWMTALIYHVTPVLGKDIKLINLEFQNPLDMLKK